MIQTCRSPGLLLLFFCNPLSEMKVRMSASSDANEVGRQRQASGQRPEMQSENWSRKSKWRQRHAEVSAVQRLRIQRCVRISESITPSDNTTGCGVNQLEVVCG
jgi:hypothetical protein